MFEDKLTENTINKTLSDLMKHGLLNSNNKLMVGVVKAILLQLYLTGQKHGIQEGKKIWDNSLKKYVR